MFGDEPLQINEAGDTIRAKARELGFTERQVFSVETGFDWNALLSASNSLSLFAEKRILELRLPGGKPGDKGSKALLEYCVRPPEDTVLLIVSAKIDAQSQKTKWFKALENTGAVLQTWPVAIRQMPGWIEHRMRAKKMRPAKDAVVLLAERVEGNLLAAAQEIEKLYLLYGEADITTDTVLASVADSARFSIYDLADAALEGDASRTTRILEGLKLEGIEPVLILWALTREIRSLCIMANEINSGSSIDQVLAKHRVWEKRKALIKQSLRRHNAAHWQHILQRAGFIDRIIKGIDLGDARDS